MLRAMIVDDEEVSVRRLKRMLAESGRIITCHSFLNPVEAYSFVENNPIDVAFLDISMPEIDGMSLSRLIKNKDASIRIVFVTGYDEYAVQAFEVSALDYLLKPVTAKRLAQTLDKLDNAITVPTAKPQLKIQMFNGMHVHLDQRQEPIKFRSPKTEELFAFLVCKREASREEIIDTLWAGHEPEKAWKNLNSTLYYIRKALNETTAGQYIQSTREGISLIESSVDCDLYDFKKLIKQIRRGSDDCAGLLTEVDTLYTGSLLSGKGYEWAVEISRLIEQEYIELLELAVRIHLASNQMLHALHDYREIIKLDPMREDIHFEIMKLLVKLGRNNEAIQQFRNLAALLQQELGLKPDHRIAEYVARL